MIPKYPQFKILKLDDKPHFEKALMEYTRNNSELNFATQFIWQDFERPMITKINGNLCVLLMPKNEQPAFLEPIGRTKIIDTLKTCLDHAGRVSRVSEQYAHVISRDCYDITPVRNHFDYVYKVADLASMKGRRYDSKRNFIKRFNIRYSDYEFRPLEKSDKSAAMRILNLWYEDKKNKTKKQTSASSSLTYMSEVESLEKAFSSFDELDLMGGGIRIDGELRGIVIGSKLTPRIADAHFMYGDPEIQNIYPVMMQDCCRYMFKDYTYVNMEQDLGIPGLRKSKLSYHPTKIEEKFEIKLRD